MAKNEHDTRGVLTKLPSRNTWAVTDEGLTIYHDGQPVCVVPVRSFGNLIYELAKVMRSSA